MAFENSGFSPADMAAVLRNNNGDGFGNGNSGWWVILFFLLCLNGGWNNGWNNGGGNAPAQYVAADVQRGFDQQATTSQISQLQTQVGQGFADNAVAQCQGNANTVGAKDVIANGLNQLAMSQQNCCCENRQGIADLKYTVATEACADRAAVTTGLQELTAQNNMNTNAITAAISNGIQSIKDDFCADRLAAKDAQIQNLQNQLNMASLAASQTAQTAQLLTYGNQQAQNIINSCCPKPVPAYAVPNPNCGCGGFYGGCGA